MLQQILVFGIVAAATVYVLRSIWLSLRSILEAKKGCGEGCVNCAFAKNSAPSNPLRISDRTDIIPLQSIPVLRNKRMP